METTKEAKETIIFIIENEKIEETKLYDFVMESAEMTTSPVGVMSKLHIRHEMKGCRYGRMNAVNNDAGNGTQVCSDFLRI